MNYRDFCYWLHGLLELQPDLKNLNEEQVSMIRKHLDLTFTQTIPFGVNVSYLDIQGSC